ncbi:MAG: hypothetical protein AB7L17_09475 [Ilumatobacteraceae bacterium]
METALKQLLALAARRHSVVTDATMRALGLTIEQRKRLVRDGHLQRLLDGSYLIGGADPDELSRCAAVCGRPNVVVCAPTAGRLWNMRRTPRDGLVWVIAPPASNPTVEPWVRPYRTALIDPVTSSPVAMEFVSPPRANGCRPLPPSTAQ